MSRPCSRILGYLITKYTVTTRQRCIAELMRQDALNLTETFRPLLLGDGSFPETVDTLIHNAKEEISKLKVRLFIQVRSLSIGCFLRLTQTLAVAMCMGSQALKRIRTRIFCVSVSCTVQYLYFV